MPDACEGQTNAQFSTGLTFSYQSLTLDITDFQFPTKKHEVVEVTTYADTGGILKAISPNYDSGEITLTVLWLETMPTTGVMSTFVITYPDGTKDTGCAAITSYGSKGQVKGLMTTEMVLTISGDVTRTAS